MSLHKVRNGTSRTVLPRSEARVTVRPCWSTSGAWLIDAGMARVSVVPAEAGGGPGGPEEQAPRTSPAATSRVVVITRGLSGER
jgi:hypothetical protein